MMDGNAVNAALEAVLARGTLPREDDGPYIWVFRDKEGAYEGGVFNATRFAIDDPDGFTNWIMGQQDPEQPLNSPRSSDREAIKLLPRRLQKRIKRFERQRKEQDG